MTSRFETATDASPIRYAARMRFPFQTLRPGQDLMMRDVDGAAESGLVLLCSAPSGIGKTAAALYPTLKRALAEDRKLFLVTAKNSQQELALETLRRMIAPETGIVALQLQAKERSCPLDGRRCGDRGCRYLERFQRRLEASGLVEELTCQGVVDGPAIQLRAAECELCPFEVSLALALRAHVVVADFNYVFDPNVYLRRFFDVPYDRHLLVVDEAHNLLARAKAYYSPALDLERMREMAARCLRRPSLWEVGSLLQDLTAHCAVTFSRLAEERSGPPPFLEPPDAGFFETIAARLDDALQGYAAFLASGERRPRSLAPEKAPGTNRLRDPVREALFAIRDFCRCCEADPELFATLWSRDSVKILCLDPAPFLRERAQGFHAAIFMSATLTPFEFYRRTLGADGRDVLQLELPSPFPRENRCLIGVSSVDTRYRQRSDHAPEIARILRETIRLRPGNYLAFFPSFAYRDEVAALLEPGDYRVLLQTPGMPTQGALARLRSNRGETLLLCAVHGGVFAEGVDYPDEMAIGVFVVGPGLPAVTEEQELVRDYYERQLGAGFEYAYVFPGLNRAVQAGGRAIRTPTDRAFVMLLGRRFAEPLYRSKLPAYWQAELLETDDPVGAVRAFWEAAPARAPAPSAWRES